MRRINLTAGLLFLAFAVVVMCGAWALEYYSPLGPGPGFFPFWLGGLLALLSAIWLGQTFVAWRKREGVEGAPFLPGGRGLVRVVAIIGSLVVLVAVMGPLGFKLTMFAFLLFLLVALGRVNVGLTLAVAIVGSFGVNYVFKTWLDVQLPSASIAWLAGLGL